MINRTAEKDTGKGGSRIGEVVGGTAAVCCCCPCVVVHLLILAYKLPCGILRKKKRKLQTRRRLRKKSTVVDHYPQPAKNIPVSPFETENMLNTTVDYDDDELESGVDLEMEVLDQFCRGFWRSTSQKEN